MSGPLVLRSPVRGYAWGSTTAIPALLGVVPDGTPQAELWLGAHPDAPSEVLQDGTAPRRLDQLVLQRPGELLGERVRAAFGDRLPYLLKVLAAAEPLSLQVHPSAEQARSGFEDEEAAGVPREAPQRRYRDPFHKPEMILALTRFEALCGLRPVADTRALLAAVDPGTAAWAQVRALLDHDDDATATLAVLGHLLRRRGGADLVRSVVERCAGLDPQDEQTRRAVATVLDLHRFHPGDPGVLVSLLLNRVTLTPGEALYLPAGNAHAYLSGTGVEVMAASDNVLRAGLTPKHVDVDELLRVLDPAPAPLPVVRPLVSGPVATYRPDAAELELHLVRAPGKGVAVAGDGPRVVLALEGATRVRCAGEERVVDQGGAVLVPDAAGPMRLAGDGVSVVAAVPA